MLPTAQSRGVHLDISDICAMISACRVLSCCAACLSLFSYCATLCSQVSTWQSAMSARAHLVKLRLHGLALLLCCFLHCVSKHTQCAMCHTQADNDTKQQQQLRRTTRDGERKTDQSALVRGLQLLGQRLVLGHHCNHFGRVRLILLRLHFVTLADNIVER